MRIFLDLDNTIINFVKGAANLFGEDYELLLERWPRGTYDMEKVLGISREQFFDTITRAGEDFWVNLLPYPYASDFYSYCANLAPTYILSAPTYDPGSLSGKMRWLHNMFGRNFREYIFTFFGGRKPLR